MQFRSGCVRRRYPYAETGLVSTPADAGERDNYGERPVYRLLPPVVQARHTRGASSVSILPDAAGRRFAVPTPSIYAGALSDNYIPGLQQLFDG